MLDSGTLITSILQQFLLMVCVQILVDGIDDAIFNQLDRIVDQQALAYLGVLDGHELAEQVERDAQRAQVGDQALLGIFSFLSF